MKAFNRDHAYFYYITFIRKRYNIIATFIRINSNVWSASNWWNEADTSMNSQ